MDGVAMLLQVQILVQNLQANLHLPHGSPVLLHDRLGLHASLMQLFHALGGHIQIPIHIERRKIGHVRDGQLLCGIVLHGTALQPFRGFEIGFTGRAHGLAPSPHPSMRYIYDSRSSRF